MANKRTITVPFSYTITGTRPRHREVETFTVVDSILAEAQCISSEEAPLALRARPPLCESIPITMCVHDGVLYSEVSRLRRLPMGQQETVDLHPVHETWSPAAFDEAMKAVAEGRERFAISDYPVSMRKSSCGFSPDATEKGLALRSVSSSTREEASLRAAAQADGAFLFIDDVLHARSKEPRWLPYASYDQDRQRSVMRLTVVRSDLKLARETNFRIDRLEDALAYARTLAEKYGKPFDEPDLSLLEDTGAHRWTFDDDAAAARAWSWAVVQQVKSYGDQVLAGDDGVLSAYMDLRRAASDRELTLARARDAVDAMDAALLTLPAISDTFRRNYDRASQEIRLRIEMFGFPAAPDAGDDALSGLRVTG